MQAKREDQDKRRKAHLAVQHQKRQQQQQLLQLFIVLAADRDRGCAERCPLTSLPLDVLYVVIGKVWEACDALDRRPEALSAMMRFVFDNIREIRSKLFWSDSQLRILERRQRAELSATLVYHFQLYERPVVFRQRPRGTVVEECTRRVKQCCSADVPRFYYSLIQPMCVARNSLAPEPPLTLCSVSRCRYYTIRGPPEPPYGLVWPSSYYVEP
jgi:hypothetical protein